MKSLKQSLSALMFALLAIGGFTPIVRLRRVLSRYFRRSQRRRESAAQWSSR